MRSEIWILEKIDPMTLPSHIATIEQPTPDNDTTSHLDTPVIQSSVMSQTLDDLCWNERMNIFSAYGLTMADLTTDEIKSILQSLIATKQTFPYFYEVLMSNRYPYTIMLICARFGMYIPPRKRCGLDTYKFFIANIAYYEPIFDRLPNRTVHSFNKIQLNIYDVYMSHDPCEYLMRLHDDEVMCKGYKFSRDYSDRKVMIETFIRKNINVYGKFKLESNSKSIYDTKTKVITYIDGTTVQRGLSVCEADVDTLVQRTQSSNKSMTVQQSRTVEQGVNKMWYSVDELIRALDNGIKISRLSLHHLRQQILEKSVQWRQQDGYCQPDDPKNLYRLLDKLEKILGNEVRNKQGAYFGTPGLSN